MGRRKHLHPTRAEKERVRKKRISLMKRVKATASVEEDVDIILMFKYQGEIFYYDSEKRKDVFPSTIEEIKRKGNRQDPRLEHRFPVQNMISRGVSEAESCTSSQQSLNSPLRVPWQFKLQPPPVLEKSPVIDHFTDEDFSLFSSSTDYLNLSDYSKMSNI